MPNSHSYVVRCDSGSTMWLTRESPLVWGDRERAKRYRSKGDAMRAADRIKIVRKITIEPTPT